MKSLFKFLYLVFYKMGFAMTLLLAQDSYESKMAQVLKLKQILCLTERFFKILYLNKMTVGQS